MRITCISIAILVLCITPGYAQTLTDTRDNFNDAEYFFNRGDYKEAAYYYRLVLEKYPDHANFNFKLGECYLNIPGSELQAIECFKKAVIRTVPKNRYRKRDFNETNAPLHAWYYLGNAYRLNNQLGEALDAYTTFVNSPFYYGNYNVNIVENEIKSCERAKIILDTPIEMNEVLLDSVVNTASSETYPVISTDGQTLIFVRSLTFYDAILLTSRVGESWSQPVNLNPLVGSDGDFYPVCLSHDGNELYLVKKDEENSDLYVSYHKESSWSKAESLGRKINSTANETWACLSSDGKTLWFTSSKKRGTGGLDIYFSHRDDAGKWGKSKNAGNMINTEFDEESPFLANHDSTLFFSSKGHYSMGGLDIFYSDYNGKSWADPINIGYPINNTSDNSGFMIIKDGRTGYYSRLNGSSEDIYQVTLKTVFTSPK
jgi:tetratricopeptide (TPR) repeat protein